MRGLARLALLHAWHHRGQTFLLTACLAITVLVPLATRVVVDRYESELTARARATPLLAGPEGNRFDLTLGALYFRPNGLEPVPFSLVSELQRDGDCVALPLSVRFTARGFPIVATGPEYYDLRALRPVAGRLPLRLGETVLGARVAAELGVTVGESVYSDPRELYDISKPAALKLQVVGVLAASGTADDRGVFVDVKTAWILEGLAHGHQAADEVDPSLVVARAGANVALSGAVIEHNEVTPENVAGFHVHQSDDKLPLSAVLVWPRDAKAAAILDTRLDLSPRYQMVRPAAVVEDLLAVVFRVRTLLDGLSLVLGLSTVLLAVLVLWLSMRLRRSEMETLERIGCSPNAVFWLYALESGAVLVLSSLFALAGRALLALWLPDLSSTLR